MIILEISIITSLWCIGLEAAGMKGMLLYKAKVFCQKKVSEGELIYKPVYECPYCMPTIHSVFGYFFLWVNSGWYGADKILLYPAVVCTSTAIIWLYLSLISFLQNANNKPIS